MFLVLNTMCDNTAIYVALLRKIMPCHLIKQYKSLSINQWHLVYAPKIESRHDANFGTTNGAVGCYKDNFIWHRRRQTLHNDNARFSVYECITVKPLIKSHLSRQINYWPLRCSWRIACRRCSNYIFILDLTPSFNELGKHNCKTRRETFKC